MKTKMVKCKRCQGWLRKIYVRIKQKEIVVGKICMVCNKATD